MVWAWFVLSSGSGIWTAWFPADTLRICCASFKYMIWIGWIRCQFTFVGFKLIVEIRWKWNPQWISQRHIQMAPVVLLLEISSCLGVYWGQFFVRKLLPDFLNSFISLTCFLQSPCCIWLPISSGTSISLTFWDVSWRLRWFHWLGYYLLGGLWILDFSPRGGERTRLRIYISRLFGNDCSDLKSGSSVSKTTLRWAFLAVRILFEPDILRRS